MTDLEPDRRPIAARRLGPVVRLAGWLARRGASANAISLAGMGCGLLAGGAFALIDAQPGWARPLWLLGAVLIQLRLLANLLDGMVAIARGVASPVGELFNEVPDRVSDTAILVGAGLAAGTGWSLGLLAALAAMSTAYVRALGRALGRPSDFSGPMAKQQRMFCLTVLAVWCVLAPAGWGLASMLPAVVLAAVAVLSALTAVRRLLRLATALREER